MYTYRHIYIYIYVYTRPQRRQRIPPDGGALLELELGFSRAPV